MKIFPYVLARIGGLPTRHLADLSWSDKEQLEGYLNGLKLLEKQRQDVLSELLSLINQVEDYPAKFYLKIIRRDIYNRRNFKVKPFEYKGSFEIEFLKVREAVRSYKKLLSDQYLTAQNFKEVYEAEVNQLRNQIQGNTLPEALSKGLQLASHSLLSQIESYQSKQGQKANKKIRQTEQSLLQYLTRVSAKTSPFSSFTKLALIDLEGKIKSEEIRKIRLNNSLYRIFRDGLIHYPPFYINLNIRLNSSLKSIENEWVFLLNTRNIESVQRMDKSDIVDFLIIALKEVRQSISFTDFVKKLLEEVEADESSMRQYVLQLIDYGLIEWDWPFSGLDPEWHLKLRDLLADYSKNSLLTDLKNMIEQVVDLMTTFENGDLKTRKRIQLEAFDLLKNKSEELLQVSGLSDLKQSATSDHLKKIFSTEFNLVLEQIFYEDVSQEYQSDFSKEDFERVGKELNELSYLMSPFYYNVKKEKIQHFFKGNFSTERVDLLTFYEAYFKDPIFNVPASSQAMIGKRNEFLKEILNKGKWKTLDHFHLDFEDFPKVNEELQKEHKSKASLIQLFEEDGKIKAFADTIFMGYGKMFGRVLHLFPEELTNKIKENNLEINKAHLSVECVDASVYNPNVHPSLVPLEFQMPGSQNNLPKSNRISIEDLEICLKNNSLTLEHKSLSKEIITYNFGFEALENRSPMYQLLMAFGLQSASPELLNILLDHNLSKKEDSGIINKPRISIGEHLVIQRRSWGIPKTLIPQKLNAGDHASYFIKINEWRKSLSIPAIAFIKLNSDEYPGNKKIARSDDYKPQFMDFQSPLMVQLFAKLLNKVPEVLKIEEALPGIDMSGKEEEYVSEYLLEWNVDKLTS